ncbi:hypothetical protein BO94DRAFT_499330 [Aspergillus sclerotioniger CBS 115572]|uniref:Rhodopsin domain-containing protein n=1 Tax=Aspergillus sclerotioniger CBS 115572 TaxID=1450535 RepID=A0A317VNT1_9EURO|nr:hypothetical protein BO94DRAFT_499330 [Aspergillus sclerotioniger CBS 115572]PWY76003.1 hypothetical protein BO94DRAFT_499330 [Aspergillus sclerotioniger CBS 115572]
MADPKAPFETLSEDDHGPIITLVSVALLITAIIFVAAKLGSVLYFKQRRSAVNTPVWLALVLLLIEVAVIQQAVNNGIGRHLDTLAEAAIQTASKYLYAAQLLQIVILSLSQLSTILLVWKLTPHDGIRRTCLITTGLTAAWTIFALFGVSFQCQMPDPWIYNPSRCAGQGAILYPISVIQILTEAIIVAIPFFMMRNVQIKLMTRVKILASFSARTLVIALGIAHLSVLPSFLHSTDVTWTVTIPTVCAQAMICTTVIIACLPTLYHIFAGLHSGLITTRLPDEVELKHPYLYGRQSTVRSTRSNTKALAGLETLDGSMSRNQNSVIRRSSMSDSMKHLTEENTGNGVLMTVDITVEVEDR